MISTFQVHKHAMILQEQKMGHLLVIQQPIKLPRIMEKVWIMAIVHSAHAEPDACLHLDITHNDGSIREILISVSLLCGLVLRNVI